LVSATTIAADGGSNDPADTTTGLVFRWLNFLLVFGGGAYLLARYGGRFFRDRAGIITASIRESESERAVAEQELREVEQKVALLDQEISRMRGAATEESAAEAMRIAESGEREIGRVQQAAQAEIVAAERVARQELKALAAGLAVEQAGALVRSRMDAGKRAALFQTFLGQLRERPN